MALENLASEYFRSLNTIASRLHADLEETKGAYEDLWKTLSKEEQDQILTESIIKPEVSVRYKTSEKKPCDEYAVRIVMDDHCSYRDEHSGPFSFRTKSQRNLTVFEPNHVAMNQNEEPPISKSNLNRLPKSAALHTEELNLEGISVVTRNESGLNSNSSTLPKTGLDFLDNW
ncbi:hypothetical protein ABEB36_002464 [Hypothenemus hampei]|uniref:DUF4706 domain-containing protein n=1 Tax=Hypothenemus hampei TaxID=57062 RepID=A0ABD1F9H3_HYPHA